MRSRVALVRELVEELRPVRRAPSATSITIIWLAGAWIFVSALTLATGGMRPGAFTQLSASPRFLGEMLLGLLTGVVAMRTAADLGVPRPPTAWRRSVPALLMMAGWVGAYLYGLRDPALEPSMLGKRAVCYLEVLAFAAPPMAAAIWLIRQAFPLARVWTGAMVAAAAGAVPGLLMQLSCMYDAAHILSHHLAPIAAAAFVGGLLGPAAFRRL